MYEKLTKYAGALAGRDLGSHLGCGTLGMEDFADDFCGLHDDDLDDLGFADCHYYVTLERYGVDDSDGIAGCDIERAPAELVLACITWCIRGDHFCDGFLGIYVRNGFIDRCLARLKELDEG